MEQEILNEPIKKKKRKKKKKKIIKKRRKNNYNFHLIFFLVVIALFLFAIIKFFLWSKGETSDYDPNEVTTEFDVETMDYIQPMDSSRFEGIEDDGVTTILCLGNAPFADNNNLYNIIQKYTDFKMKSVLNFYSSSSTLLL